MAEPVEHEIALADLGAVVGSGTLGTDFEGPAWQADTVPCVVVSPGITVTAGDTVEGFFTPAETTGGSASDSLGVFLALGTDVTNAADDEDQAPIVTPPTVLLGTARTEGGSYTPDPTPVTGTVPAEYTGDHDLVIGAWGRLVRVNVRAMSVNVTAGDPEPDPDPYPEPDPDPMDTLAAELAPRVAAYLGRKGDADTEAIAEGQLAVVAEFVRGYTRGNGWTDDRPEAPLRAAIVSAASRLAINPEQVRQYTAGDYSETPAILLGFTLAERHVLDRYRVRWA